MDIRGAHDSDAILRGTGEALGVDAIVRALRKDQVVLLERTAPEAADELLVAVASNLGLRDQLELQATFASIRGHRENVGRSFMTVNRRDDYQFITAHSEGAAAVGMQFAAFYCFENSTDGGHTILLNVDSESPAWARLREFSARLDLCGRSLSTGDIASIRMRHHIFIPRDLLRESDQILAETPSPVENTRTFNVLSTIEPQYSTILESDVYTYWDTVSSYDHDSGRSYYDLLSTLGLLRLPPGGRDLPALDNAHPRRVWSSGVAYSDIFKRGLNHKLAPGDLLLQNNLTWTHSVSNWTPGSGVRRVVAAFA